MRKLLNALVNSLYLRLARRQRASKLRNFRAELSELFLLFRNKRIKLLSSLKLRLRFRKLRIKLTKPGFCRSKLCADKRLAHLALTNSLPRSFLQSAFLFLRRTAQRSGLFAGLRHFALRARGSFLQLIKPRLIRSGRGLFRRMWVLR